MTNLTWYEATAFVNWLNEQLSQVIKAAGYMVRLPTEAEWEIAAAYDFDGETRRYYPWGNDKPTTDVAIYEKAALGHPASVGICPEGAASCGALDMAGNIWEWTSSSFEQYPNTSEQVKSDFMPATHDVPSRGGAFWSSDTYLRSGVRGRSRPDYAGISHGFRLVLAPIPEHVIHI